MPILFCAGQLPSALPRPSVTGENPSALLLVIETGAGNSCHIIGAGVEEALQNQYRGHLIHHHLVFGSGATRQMQQAMGLSCSQPLIPQGHGQTELLPQHFRKGLSLDSLRTEIAGHIQRIADDDLSAGMFAQDARERAEVLTAIAADQGEDWLGGDASLVGDSHANATVAYVKTQDPGDGGWRNGGFFGS